MPTVSLNGVDLVYEQRGQAGPMLVLTHGSWGDRRGWSSVLAGLAASFQVVTWDRRGHGESSNQPGQGTREQDVADLAALIDTLGVGPVHAVGNSFGGSITLALAARRPDLLRSIAVHEPPVFDVLSANEGITAHEARQRIAAVVALLSEGEMEAGAALFVDTVVGQAGAWANMPTEAQAAMINVAPTFLDENLDPGVFSLDVEGLSRFDRPALLSYGDASPIYFSSVVRTVAAGMPASTVHVFTGAGHVPHRSHPADFVGRITRFVLGQESSVTR